MFEEWRPWWGPSPMQWTPPNSQSQSPNSGFGILLIVLLSIIYLAGAVSGLAQLTGIPFFGALIVAGILYLMKMYFLRRQLWYEQFSGNGWDRVAGYLATAVVFVTLVSYGLYGINLMINTPPAVTQASGLQHGDALQPERILPQPNEAPAPRRESSEPGASGEAWSQSDQPLPVDDPQTEYREDRPRWWNDELRKLKSARKPTDDRSLANKPPSQSVSTEKAGPQPEAKTERVVANSLISPNTDEIPKSAPFRLAPKATVPPVTLAGFVNDTLSQSNRALGCWLLSAILEGFIAMLVVFNRPQLWR